MSSIHVQSACQGDVEASLKVLNISGTVDKSQILKEMW